MAGFGESLPKVSTVVRLVCVVGVALDVSVAAENPRRGVGTGTGKVIFERRVENGLSWLGYTGGG